MCCDFNINEKKKKKRELRLEFIKEYTFYFRKWKENIRKKE